MALNKQERNTLSQYKKIEEAKEFLRNEGYMVDNLWHIDDVKGKFECDDDMAKSVLKTALTNDATMTQIWLAIDIAGEMEGLNKLD